MDVTLRVFIFAVSMVLFFGVMYMLVKRVLNESNSLIWMFTGFLALLLGIFPGTIDSTAHLLGIDYPPSLLFLLAIILLLVITFKGSMDMSKTEAKLNELAITVSILDDENRRLAKLVDGKATSTNIAGDI